MEKIVNGSVFVKKKEMWVLYKEAPSSRRNSWITFDQICKEYPEFIDKLCDIVTCPQYPSKAREFARSIMDYVLLWKFVSWKQFDSIMLTLPSYEEYKKSLIGKTQLVNYGRTTSIRRGIVSFTYISRADLFFNFSDLQTDKGIDKLSTLIFGEPPRFEEEEIDGLVRSYTRNGDRIFLLPTDESIEDYSF
jgi:hypothetical protein